MSEAKRPMTASERQQKRKSRLLREAESCARYEAALIRIAGADTLGEARGYAKGVLPQFAAMAEREKAG